MSSSFLERVFVEEGAFRYSFTNAILSRLPDVPVKLIKSPKSKGHGHNIDMGKGTLHLLPYKGEFLKPCPGTKEYICCGYQILNVAANCPLDCSYCILQSYFNQPYLRVFVNLHEQVEHVLKVIDCNSDRIYRVGTGEFTDSLALDPFTFWSDLLLPQFSKRKNAVLEVKTKTTRIESLLASNSRDRIIVSWSLNSSFIAEREEHGAASIKKRLDAARRCQSEGFVVGFHFDPLIPHPGWKEGYLNTIDLMEKYIDPKGVMWISLGSFRFMPGLKPIIRKRHPGTCVLDGEFILGLDGKMRYFKPIRIDLYAFMKENLEKWSPGLCLYLCMESDDVWHKSLGWSPENSEGLCHYLDRRVVEIFG
jgi:spore photoproduct lyase